MVRILYLLLAALLALFYYYFVGAGPGPSELFEEPAWWQPRGWLLRWEPLLGFAELAGRAGPERMIPAAVLCIPAVALAVGGLALFRSALARALALGLGLTLCLFSYYGVSAESVWRLFEWRFAIVAAALAAIVAAAVYGPSLLRALADLPRVAAALVLLAAFAGIIALQTEVTGTNSALVFNISPWPVITAFGMLIAGYAIAALHLCAGSGLCLAASLRGLTGGLSGCAIAGAGAGVLSLFIFSDPSALLVAGFALAAVAYTAGAVLLATGRRTPPLASALSRVGAGVFVFAAVGIGNEVAQANQVTARDTTAPIVLLALEQYRREHDAYPERLADLVPDYLEEVPRPPIGFIRNEGDRFEYSNFGDSYALEFASVQWVQCTYGSDYEYASSSENEDGSGADASEYEEAYANDEQETWEEFDSIDVAAGESEEDRRARERLRAAGLGGSWNCPKAPPEVW